MHRGRFRFWMVMAFVVVPFLGGCQGALIGPIKLGSSAHVESQDDGKPELTAEATVAIIKQGILGVVVGWEHSYKTDEATHEQIYNRIYRGGVKFDLSTLIPPSGKTIGKATLNYAIQEGAKSSETGTPTSCATKLLLATEDWHGIPEMDVTKAPDTFAGEPYKDGLPEKPVGSFVSLDVTDAVKAWVDGTRANHGFVFAGSTEDKGLFKNNDKCWSLLSGFTLRVKYSSS